MNRRPLRDEVLATYNQIDTEHWGRLHRGGLVHLVAERLRLDEYDVHDIINDEYGEVELDKAELEIPADTQE